MTLGKRRVVWEAKRLGSYWCVESIALTRLKGTVTAICCMH